MALPRQSRKWDWASPTVLVFAERAVEDSPRSTRAIRDDLGLPLKMRGEERTKIELVITVLDKH
jgi:hypothetical protein